MRVCAHADPRPCPYAARRSSTAGGESASGGVSGSALPVGDAVSSISRMPGRNSAASVTAPPAIPAQISVARAPIALDTGP